MNYHLIADIRDRFTFQLKTQSAKTGIWAVLQEIKQCTLCNISKGDSLVVY